jgi:hypothetical protein
MNRHSGRYRGKRKIQGGRVAVRAPLYMACLVAIQHNPALKSFYRRLRAAGKPARLARSIIRLLGLDLAIPGHSTLSRRAETLAVARPPSSAEPVHLLVDSTGLRLSGAGEWLSRSTAPAGAGRGANCTSASMLTRARIVAGGADHQ